MPEITRFYGIVVKIFFRNEHNPPHIHAIYGDHNGLIDIATLEMIEGDLPQKALELVQEWAKQHQDKLMTMWEQQKPEKLPPLN